MNILSWASNCYLCHLWILPCTVTCILVISFLKLLTHNLLIIFLQIKLQCQECIAFSLIFQQSCLQCYLQVQVICWMPYSSGINFVVQILLAIRLRCAELFQILPFSLFRSFLNGWCPVSSPEIILSWFLIVEQFSGLFTDGPLCFLIFLIESFPNLGSYQWFWCHLLLGCL